MAVRGGRLYGRWPGLAPEQLFESRDLAATTDFRTLFHEVTTAHLAVPATGANLPRLGPLTRAARADRLTEVVEVISPRPGTS